MADAIKTNGGTGALLTTLASSGDKMIQLLIVAGIIANGIMTNLNGSATRKQVDKARETAAKQIKAIYQNQSQWERFERTDIAQRQLIMEALNIPKEKWPQAPNIKIHKVQGEEGEEQ